MSRFHSLRSAHVPSPFCSKEGPTAKTLNLETGLIHVVNVFWVGCCEIPPKSRHTPLLLAAELAWPHSFALLIR